MSRSLATHYARLGLSPGATRAEVAAAFRARALREHPDVGGCASAFAELRAARDALLAPGVGSWEPASIRMYRYRGRGAHATDKFALLGSVVLPTGLGMLVGLQLLYRDDGNRVEGAGVRAGGNSRVRIDDLPVATQAQDAGGDAESRVVAEKRPVVARPPSSSKPPSEATGGSAAANVKQR